MDMKTYIILLLTLAVSCGNPHLKKIDRPGSKTIPVIAQPEILEKLGIKMNDGLFLQTEEPSISEKVELLNLDIDKDWEVEIAFEKGTNFRFKGNQFPGKNGSCREVLSGKENCLLEIEFHSISKGHYADNLKIKYTNIQDPLDKRHLDYPLRGERISKVQDASALITIRTQTNAKILDFGKSFINETIQSKLIVKNEGNTLVSFETKLENNRDITFGSEGTCGKELAPNEECLLDIIFNASIIGLYQDQVILSYDKGTVNFPILGEKVKKKKQGPLIASEVFSSNIDFGKVKTGITVNKEIEIQNLGETIYNVKGIILDDQNVFKVTSTCGDIIYPGTCLIGLSYTPIEAKKDSGSLKIITKEGDSVKLNLAGTGVEDQLCESYNEYLVVPEKSYPSAKVIFPYLKSHPSTTSKLSYLYGTEVNGYVKATDNYVVADGMVYITFKLPKMEGEITNMNFGVNVFKVIRDNYKDTESLCLSSKGIRKCSGHEFSLDSWKKLKNPAFWDIHNRPVSERYEKQFANGEKQCGPFRCMSLNTQYELSDIFEMNSEEMKTLREEGTITLIFSDDTRMLSMPRIAIKTKTMGQCK